MSRVGKQSIAIPAGTEVSVADGFVSVKGKGGELKKPLHQAVEVKIENNEVTVHPVNETRLSQALWGTYASHIKNMVAGVNEPFVKKMTIEGVGYRAEMSGNTLKLNVGYSHPVELQVPEGLTVTVEKAEISVSGANKEHVGQFAAEVRAKRPPEPYKGKGIRYNDEVVRRKQGKRAA